MNDTGGRSSLKKIGAIKRKSIGADGESLVKRRLMVEGSKLPLLFEPAVEGIDLIRWAADHKEELNGLLLEHGGLLFRGFAINSAETLEELVHAASGDLLEYGERSTPRHQVHANVYTSTDYPPAQSIFPHNENSYQQTFPLHLYFHCAVPAEAGGETPIHDCRNVYRRIRPDVVERFKAKRIMYVRNFREGLGLAWQSVFQTSDRAAVDAYCAAAEIEPEWISDTHLRIRRVLPAVALHPRTGEELWFNHGTFFHATTLEEPLRSAMLSQYREEELPNHTYYGDGSPIEPETVAHLRECYMAEKIMFPWQQGDVLWLDNMLVAHAREPYRGQRKILAAMALATQRTPSRG